MAEQRELDSAAAAIAISNTASVQISSIAGRRYWQLKSWAREHVPGTTRVLFCGRELPRSVGEVLLGPLRTSCLAPGEWLIIADEETLLPQSPDGMSIVDVTHGWTAFEIRGAAGKELLSRGCGLDLDPSRFPAGRCARTRFARIAAIIYCMEDTCIELIAARSYERYLYDWLVDAASGLMP